METDEELAAALRTASTNVKARPMDTASPQPAPSESVGPAIVDLVVKDLQERSETGKKKYGTLLRANNGRVAIVDAYQEALDMCMYLRQKIEEENPPKSKPAIDVALLLASTSSPQIEALAQHARDCAEAMGGWPEPELQGGPGDEYEDEESPLVQAYRLVHGPRGQNYGHPLDDFSRTAGMVSALWSKKLNAPLTAEDVASFMICVKLSREENEHKPDNLIDGAGYFETKRMVIDERARRQKMAVEKETE